MVNGSSSREDRSREEFMILLNAVADQTNQ
jgi:hypothetical protein